MPLILEDIYMWSPNDPMDVQCVKFISTAKVSLLIADYSFNLVAAVDAIIERHQVGVAVQLVLDHSQSLGNSEVPQIKRLRDAGVDIVVGTSSVGHQIMHQKFMVKDARVTWWGSWNITRMASEQANTVEIKSSHELAAKFTEDWQFMHDWILANELHYQLVTPEVVVVLPIPPVIPAPPAV